MTLRDNECRRLILAAESARKNAYAPYSHFQVGAALLCEDGSVFTGANVENSSYPAGLCAERSALAAAVSSGQRRFIAVAVTGCEENACKRSVPCYPCGICRQALSEFTGGELLVISALSEDDYRVDRIDELLPLAFSLSVNEES